MPGREEQPSGQRVKPAEPTGGVWQFPLARGTWEPEFCLSGPSPPTLLPLEKLTIPSSTTKVGIAPLPCSIDTTLSWEQFLWGRGEPVSELPWFILESQAGLG